MHFIVVIIVVVVVVVVATIISVTSMMVCTRLQTCFFYILADHIKFSKSLGNRQNNNLKILFVLLVQ